MTRPVDIVASRLDIVHGRPPKFRARCPAHGSRGGTLSVSESRDGAVLLHCFAGCDNTAILHAIGLAPHDLFPASEIRNDERRRLERIARTRSRRDVAEIVIAQEVKRERSFLKRDLGYVPPLRAAHLNAARQRAARRLAIELPHLPAFDWECPGCDDDPLWPELFRVALDEEIRLRWSHLCPEQSGDLDPLGPSDGDRRRATERAARWLHEVACAA